jgi:hypothetical protein
MKHINSVSNIILMVKNDEILYRTEHDIYQEGGEIPVRYGQTFTGLIQRSV